MTLQTLRQTLHNPPQPSTVRKRLDVEQLLQWAYAEERVHEAAAERRRPVRHFTPGRSNAACVADMLALGTVVDRSLFTPEPSGSDRVVGRDALAVDGLVREMDADLQRMVIWCAVHRRRPEALVNVAPRPVARTWGANDRPVVVYADTKCRKPLYCPVDYTPSAAEITSARGQYRTWWLAVDWLREYLPEVLQDHELTGFVAEAEPWS